MSPTMRADSPLTGEPIRQESREERLAAVTVGELRPLNSTVQIAPYDHRWPEMYSLLAGRIRAALSRRVLLLEHVGSTSIEGLPAKPVIDILLAVEDSCDESSYVPQLESRGFELRIREPDWFEHRLLKCAEIEANLHVFSAGCAEIDRMLVFRDWLRVHEEERRLYEETKLALAARTWRYIQDYADAKSDVVRAILARALAGSG